MDHRILAAATECFLNKGYEATSMDAVAARARVSKMTLYGRHPNKELLLRAVVDDRAAAWGKAASQQNWMAGTTLKQRLEHFMTIVMTWAVSDEIRQFDRLLANSPRPVAAPMYAVRYRLMVDFLAAEIEEFTGREGNAARDPQQVAADLMALVTGWFQMQSAVHDVTETSAIEYGLHAVKVLLAAREVW